MDSQTNATAISDQDYPQTASTALLKTSSTNSQQRPRLQRSQASAESEGVTGSTETRSERKSEK